jgi:hypothetical protein
MGYTPFYLVMGQHPWKGEVRWMDLRYKSVREKLQELRKVRAEASQVLLENAEQRKKVHDRWARPAHDYRRPSSPGGHEYSNGLTLVKAG